MAKQIDLLPFGEWRPDLSDLDGAHTRNILNVLPQGDGYGPIRALAALTQALGERVRGYFYARDDDGTITIFAGTSTKLWMLDNTTFTWTDVSVGAGTYTTLNSDAHWSFAQFGLIVIATQANDDVQAFTLGSSTAFADLAGSPPDAAYVTVVGQFVFLTGLTANPFRIQWSAIGSAIGWTAGTNQSDFQDLPDGGIVRNAVGGDLAIIFQDQAIRRATYSPGSAVIFQIDRIAKDIGLLHPLALSSGGDKLFFLSTRGFMMTDASGALVPIGLEKVDRTFLATYDSGAPQYTLAAVDPRAHIVVFTCRSIGMVAEGFDLLFAYHWILQRWAPLQVAGEYINSLARPGLTLEGLDALAPGAQSVSGAANNGGGLIRLTVEDTTVLVDGDFYTFSAVGGVPNANGTFAIDIINATHIDLLGSTFAGAYTSGGILGGSADLMEISWDALSTSTLPNLSVADTDHKISFFTGDTVEATLETSEQSGKGQRLLINGFWPQTDAPIVFGKIGKRETIQTARTYTNEVVMNASHGFVPTVRSTRYATGRIRIPEAQSWTFASGIRPDASPDGEI